MSRRLVLIGVVVIGVLAGVLLGPYVLGGGGEDTSPSPTAQSEEPSTAEGTTAESSPTPTEPSTNGPSNAVGSPPPSAEELEDAAAGVLGHDVPDGGSGELAVVAGEEEAPDGEAPVQTVRVEVEVDLDIDGEAFAGFVMTVLNDPRGWGADGSVRFARTDGDDPDIRVVLATPGTVDDMCAPLETNSRWSCGRYGHAALNAQRWVFGADAWLDGGGELTAYREYLVNHEVGHLLGHPHEQCPVPGDLAPVMVQQSISLDGCAPNGWPHP